MIKRRIDSIKEARLNELKAELTATDYRVLKVMRTIFQKEIERLYPGETERYNSQVEKIRILEAEEVKKPKEEQVKKLEGVK